MVMDLATCVHQVQMASLLQTASVFPVSIQCNNRFINRSLAVWFGSSSVTGRTSSSFAPWGVSDVVDDDDGASVEGGRVTGGMVSGGMVTGGAMDGVTVGTLSSSSSWWCDDPSHRKMVPFKCPAYLSVTQISAKEEWHHLQPLIA